MQSVLYCSTLDLKRKWFWGYALILRFKLRLTLRADGTCRSSRGAHWSSHKSDHLIIIKFGCTSSTINDWIVSPNICIFLQRDYVFFKDIYYYKLLTANLPYALIRSPYKTCIPQKKWTKALCLQTSIRPWAAGYELLVHFGRAKAM